MKESKKKSRKSKTKLIHQYYQYTGFYSFILSALKKSIKPIIFIVIGIIAFNTYIFNINDGLNILTQTFSDFSVLVTFFISESILLGLIPPEVFIGWAKKTSMPLESLAILATLSYLGGITSFFIGKLILKIDSVKNYMETKMSKHLKNTNKWGGFLIIVGALLPLPFAITCLAAGMIKYPLRNVMMFGVFRFLKFAINGYIIFNIVS